MTRITKIYVLLFFNLTVFLYGQLTHAEFEKDSNHSFRSRETYRFDELPDDGSYTISIADVYGNITLRGHNGSGAQLIILKTIHGLSEKKAKQVINDSKISVFHLEDEYLIRVRSEKKMQYDRTIENTLEFNLPRNVNINLEILGGDIDLADLQGESILNTLGGDVVITSFAGRIESKTSGGNMTVTETEGFIRIHSSGGNISISDSQGQFNSSTEGGSIRFSDLNGSIDAQTSGGSIELEHITGDEISCRTSGGNIQAEVISAKVTLKTSGGGINLNNIEGNIDLSTSGGNIDAVLCKGSLKCNTSAGNISLEEVIGSVDAFTSAGNISLDLTYDSSIKDYSFNMETDAGDLIVHIPKGLPVSIESTIYGTGSTKELNSEIPLKITSKGSTVKGTGTVKGGTIPLLLTAHYGSITIKQN